MLDERRKDLCKYRLKNSEDSLMVAEDCLEKGLYKDAMTIEQVKNTRSVIEAIREFIEKLDV